MHQNIKTNRRKEGRRMTLLFVFVGLGRDFKNEANNSCKGFKGAPIFFGIIGHVQCKLVPFLGKGKPQRDSFQSFPIVQVFKLYELPYYYLLIFTVIFNIDAQ